MRTLRATDRLTGMPVLLHVLDRVVILPELPHTPALLPFTDSGVDGEAVYLVTELPPHAVPASDPLLAARGALAGLAALHESGLTHGGVGPAQLWSVDGRVALAGAGLPWGRGERPEDDLRDLAATLETLGGVPAPLRDAPETLSARELLARLGRPAEPPAPPAQDAGVPEEADPAKKPPGRREGKGRGTWRLPNLARPPAGAGTPGTEPAPAPARQEPENPDTPGNVAGSAPTPPPGAPDRPGVLRTGFEDEAPAREGTARRERGVLAPSAPREAGPAPPPLLDLDLGEALGAGGELSASARERLRDTSGLPPEPDSLIGAAILHRGEGRPRPEAGGGGSTPRRVVDKPIRIGWEEDHSWRVVRNGGPAPAPARSVPRWLGPALAVAALLLILGLVWVLLAARAPRAGVAAPQARVAQACCDVRFTVRGGAGVPVRLSVVTAPEGAGVPSGAELGTVPGPVRLPGPGTYTLRVAAEGFAPGTVTITAPSSQPIAIDLGP